MMLSSDLPKLSTDTVFPRKLNAETIWDFKVLKIQKRIVSAETIRGNTVGILLPMWILLYLQTCIWISSDTLLACKSEWPKDKPFYWCIPGMLETYTIPKWK